jgi:hypothetical protein
VEGPAITPVESGTAAGPFVLRERTRFERLQGPLITGGIVGGLTIALHFRDPHSSGSWGYCPFFAMTGLYCPGCGGLRAVNDLTNGNLLGAASSNLVFVAMIPLVVLWWVRWTSRAWTGEAPRGVPSRRATVSITVFSVVLLVFGVLRNLPIGSWLAP